MRILLILITLVFSQSLAFAQPMTAMPEGNYSGNVLRTVSTHLNLPQSIQTINAIIAIQAESIKFSDGQGEANDITISDLDKEGHFYLLYDDNSTYGQGQCQNNRCEFSGTYVSGDGVLTFEQKYIFTWEGEFMKVDIDISVTGEPVPMGYERTRYSGILSKN